ncbi:hypothetical protein CDL15_Pgr025670 [Punica granatum]|uniref:Uncharacterized protein n=1 Tax=Punica granatum TaxID=22663 RepID=A0A218WC89_PUNGR|nr:hypothetical protein CDL15_Pgr025670 [Punica granatum]
MSTYVIQMRGLPMNSSYKGSRIGHESIRNIYPINRLPIGWPINIGKLNAYRIQPFMSMFAFLILFILLGLFSREDKTRQADKGP